jgi:hypothetical protein
MFLGPPDWDPDHSINKLFLLYSMKTDVNVPLNSKKHKSFEKNTYFLLVSCQALTKKTGSGSISQWYGSVPVPKCSVVEP